jgi:hypothetical protein
VLVATLTSLPALVDTVACSDRVTSRGWICDTWEVDSEAEDALRACHTELIDGHAQDDDSIRALAQILTGRGVDLDERLRFKHGDRDTVDRVTRADGCELLAVASGIAEDSWPLDRTHMPNIPKQYRARSESGIDAIAADLNPQGPSETLGTDERVYFASVKHTPGRDVAALRRELVHSIGPGEWTPVYLTRQLYIFVEQLSTAHPRILARRAFLVLDGDFLQLSSTTILLVSAVDLQMVDEARKDQSNLASVPVGTYQHRIVGIEDLARLHQRLN